MEQIISYSMIENKKEIVSKIEHIEWEAGPYLANLLKTNSFKEKQGNGDVYLLLKDKTLIGFCTFSEFDCLKDKSIYPFIGFLYIYPEYRKQGNAKKLFDFVKVLASKEGYKHIYLTSGGEHTYLYERYGYHYVKDIEDIFGSKGSLLGIDL